MGLKWAFFLCGLLALGMLPGAAMYNNKVSARDLNEIKGVLPLFPRARRHPADFFQRNRRDIPNMDACEFPEQTIPISADQLPAQLKQAFSNLDKALNKLATQNGLHSFTSAVIYDQSIIHSHIYGDVNGNPPTLDTPYRVGSINKVITDLLLLLARDHGPLDSVDSHLSQYVPALKQFSVRTGKRQDFTWRGLATQTSGIQGGLPCKLFNIEEPIFNNDCEISNAEAWKRLSAEKAIYPQYSFAHYADSAYAIIGRALEDAKLLRFPPSSSPLTYEQAVIQHIFKPLNMTNTFFDLTWERAAAVPTGYITANISLPDFIAHVDLNWARPTGQLYSTANDLAELVMFFLAAGTINDPIDSESLGLLLNGDSVREMMIPFYANTDGQTAYGFPFEIFNSDLFGSREDFGKFWIRSKTGSLPGYSSFMGMIPELKLGVVFQTNSFAALDGGMTVFENVIPALRDVIKSSPVPPANPGNLTRFVGKYETTQMLGVLYIATNISISEDSFLKLSSTPYLFGEALGSSVTVLEWIPGSGNSYSVRRQKGQPCMWLEGAAFMDLLDFTTDSTGKVTGYHYAADDPWYNIDFSRM